jgi:hypothetical protein
MPTVPFALAAVANVSVFAHWRILAASGVVKPIAVNVFVLLPLQLG